MKIDHWYKISGIGWVKYIYPDNIWSPNTEGNVDRVATDKDKFFIEENKCEPRCGCSYNFKCNYWYRTASQYKGEPVYFKVLAKKNETIFCWNPMQGKVEIDAQCLNKYTEVSDKDWGNRGDAEMM